MPNKKFQHSPTEMSEGSGSPWLKYRCEIILSLGKFPSLQKAITFVSLQGN